MKIIKKPKFEKIRCVCGCVFIPSYKDIVYDELWAVKNRVKCPICMRYHFIWRKEDENT